MNVMSLNAYRSFDDLLEIGISHADDGDHREALARLIEAMEKMSTHSEGLSAADGAALFLNLALVTGRMGRAELAMELLEKSRELFARVLGRERVIGPEQG
jgi:Flp pilus assembly protein TadD